VSLKDCLVEVTIAVSDLARAEHFYEQQLGLRPAQKDGQPDKQWVRYHCAEGTRVFVYLSKDNAGKTDATVAGFFVPDLDEAMRELSRAGVTFEPYDMPGIETDQRGVFDSGPFKAAWVKDPDGNTIAITQNY
jgi:catechol 2,3-dioxygenase-like lactoylglutathione lyase family enzyme